MRLFSLAARMKNLKVMSLEESLRTIERVAVEGGEQIVVLSNGISQSKLMRLLALSSMGLIRYEWRLDRDIVTAAEYRRVEGRIGRFLNRFDPENVIVISQSRFSAEDAKDCLLLDVKDDVEVIEIRRPMQTAINILSDAIDEDETDAEIVSRLDTLGRIDDCFEADSRCDDYVDHEKVAVRLSDWGIIRRLMKKSPNSPCRRMAKHILGLFLK